jgi:hypothetical protein
MPTYTATTREAPTGAVGSGGAGPNGSDQTRGFTAAGDRHRVVDRNVRRCAGWGSEFEAERLCCPHEPLTQDRWDRVGQRADDL